MADAKDQKQPDLSRDGLFKSDAQLEKVDRKWAQLPSDEVVEKTKNALVAKGHKCDVVDNKEAALKLLSEIDLKDSSVYCAGSTTLQEIGFTDYLKKAGDKIKRNIKEEAVAAQAKGDWGAAGEAMRQGQSADYVFTSVPAVSQDGIIFQCCFSGSRTGSLAFAAKRVVIVTGTQKITESEEAGRKRMYEFALPLESARGRIAFAAMGFKESAVMNQAQLRGANPFGLKHRVHVIFVKEALGF